MTFACTVRKPSAFLPMAMSTAVILMEALVLATVGVTHPEDEGTPAHLFQLLMGGQLPIIAFFVAKWLPRAPRPALAVLAFQVALALAAAAPVFILGW